MATNNELYNNFLTGRYNTNTEKKSNNMRIKEKNNHTIIEGYGHALYALKFGGTVVLFDEWYGYSPTTSTHLNKIRGKARSDEHINLIVSDSLEQDLVKSHRSGEILEELKCDYCNHSVTTTLRRKKYEKRGKGSELF